MKPRCSFHANFMTTKHPGSQNQNGHFPLSGSQTHVYTTLGGGLPKNATTMTLPLGLAAESVETVLLIPSKGTLMRVWGSCPQIRVLSSINRRNQSWMSKKTGHFHKAQTRTPASKMHLSLKTDWSGAHPGSSWSHMATHSTEAGKSMPCPPHVGTLLSSGPEVPAQLGLTEQQLSPWDWAATG